MDKTIPRSIHYADLKPEAIEHMVKLVRWTPQTNIQNSIPNDVVRFQLQGGRGFYDPYSAYLHIRFDFLNANQEEFAIQSQSSSSESTFVQFYTNYKAANSYHVIDIKSDSHSIRGSPDVTFVKNGGIIPTTQLANNDANITSLQIGTLFQCGFEGSTLSIDDVSTNLYLCARNNSNPRPGAEFKILDRSAHSLIHRLVIRSQGTEIERIEEYDVMAGIINDLIYSNEQAQFHSFEGFGGSLLQSASIESQVSKLRRDTLFNSAKGPRGRTGECMFGWAFVADDCKGTNLEMFKRTNELTYDIADSQGRLELETISSDVPVFAFRAAGVASVAQLCYQPMYHTNYAFRQIEVLGADGAVTEGQFRYSGYYPTQSIVIHKPEDIFSPLLTTGAAGVQTDISGIQFLPIGTAYNAFFNCGKVGNVLQAVLADRQYSKIKYTRSNDEYVSRVKPVDDGAYANLPVGQKPTTTTTYYTSQHDAKQQMHHPDWYGQINEKPFGVAFTNAAYGFQDATKAHFSEMTQLGAFQTEMVTYSSLKKFRPGEYYFTMLGHQNCEFIIPIYSGIIGVAMPDKKLLPLDLFPLDIEFTLNQHAVICAASNTFGAALTRSYQIKQMDLYAHTIFFESELHRSLQDITAEHGIFISMKSMYMAPIKSHPNKTVATNIEIDIYFKSINSIHMVFLYNKYNSDIFSRKLHFVSHNLKSIQIRNGTDFIPSEPITMDWTGGATLKTRNDDYTIGTGRSNRAFVEMLKSHGKMHDPETDTALDCGITYNLDKYATTVTDLLSDFDYRVTNSDTTTDSILTEVTKQLSEPRFNQAYHMSLFFAFNDLLIASTYAVDCARPDGAANSNDIPLVVCRRVMPNYGEAHIDSQHDAALTSLLLLTREVAFESLFSRIQTNYYPVVPTSVAGRTVAMTLQHQLQENCHYTNMMYKDKNDYIKHSYLGQFGINPKKIPLRPGIFFGNTKGPINPLSTGRNQEYSALSYLFGMSASWLNDRIQNFSALTGRCQYAISLEGINFGTDNSILTGKKGMTPFSIQVQSNGKSDAQPSSSIIFVKYDAVVYIRPDLVVTVLGR